jgi:ribonuclease III
VWGFIQKWWHRKAQVFTTYELDAMYKQLGGFYPKGSEEHFILAITHSSQNGRPGRNFEQLEFLGDAILSAVVAETLFSTFPGKREGELSKMRAWIVSRRQLGLVAQNIGLQVFIRHKIEDKRLDEARHMAGDVLEAVLGAYYLDAGIDVVREIALKWILTEETLEAARKGVIDPKSTIHEWAQQKRKRIKFVHLHPNVSQPAFFEIEFWVNEQKISYGKGRNKKEAERAAAEEAVRILGV